ncbi:MAG: MBL fold metallo-hydrolase [Planctomycetota bacterium]
MTQIHPIRLSLSNAFLVVGERPVLVDAGSPGEAGKIIAKMARHGVEPRDLSLILLTHAHADHAGAAKELRQRSGAPVALHPADAEMLRHGSMGKLRPVRPRHRLLEWFVNRPFDGLDADVQLANGQRLDAFGLAGSILETPGHCVGSVSVVLDPPQPAGASDALAGDLLIGGFLGGLVDRRRPRLPYFADDLAALQISVGRLRSAAAGRWWLGHGGPVDAARVGEDLESPDEQVGE